MFSIGDFARHGQVSVRMLRHYDAIGLLRPARVDAATGYRSYRADQLALLNRIVALKDLGFTLEQVRSILRDRIDGDELRGMLRLRQAELAARIDADRARLRQVEARLRAVESDGRMPHADIQVKSLPGIRLAELSATAASYEPSEIGPLIGPLYQELGARLARAGVPVVGPAVARYTDAPDGGVAVHAGLPVGAEPGCQGDVTIVDLPPVDRAATLVHEGPMDDVLPSYHALARWLDGNGCRVDGAAREVYLEVGPDGCEARVTELQQPVVAG
ncbi:MerR family transcriptional regulator [Plantactinospora sp. GCM10030261]|uniref:MerR family transcriptional regulator n=1 Tax=Plantactinospora sp. GCM10030261 TaxID=3273420 RepID=UPI003621C49F